jgi:hypothetical protein
MVKGQKKFTKLIAPKAGRSSKIISNKVDFKPKLVRKDKEGHFTLIKRAIHQEEITNINLYLTSVNAPNFIKHTLLDLKTQIDPNTVVVGHFHTPLSPAKYQQRNSRIK